MKKIMCLMLILFVCSAFSVPAYADFDSLRLEPIQLSDESIIIQSNHTVWYYRNNNGVEEMRLWSYTYQKWMTDWIRVS